MNHTERKKKAESFVSRWSDRGYEKGQAEPFWMALLRDCYGVEQPEEVISFEDPLNVEKSKRFVDGRIPSTRVMIEQKGSRIDLTKPDKQSGLTEKLTPFQQAHRYVLGLPVSEHPKWIVVSNFREFHIHDMERPNDKPEVVLLEKLPEELHRLRFLVDTESNHVQSEEQVSVKAGKLVGELYDKLLLQYGDHPTEEELRSLNVLCVRLVFCLYAEDAHVFKKDDQFHDYLSLFPAVELRNALIGLFRILNTPTMARSKFERSELLEFPYVNGGLFDESAYPIEIPMFTDELRTLLLDKASYGFNWSRISPTIFGAVFENTLNPKERRKGGMHYTSVENIHRLIDPLFLDSLTAELHEVLAMPQGSGRARKLNAFQDKLSGIRCLDPACGSGNFLTETFLSLRRLENRVIRELYQGQMMIGEYRNPVKVSIEQFYGIEINDFAVNVGKTAMWIAESQMRDETARMITLEDDFLPLTRQTHIHHGNALQTEWGDIVKPEELTYIVGNPPFVGKKEQTPEQKREVKAVAGAKFKRAGVLDYVSAWYLKAINYMQGTNVSAAFVSTNSIAQGEQVPVLWKEMIRKGAVIDFAHQTFVWENETEESAAVNCVIIGFSLNGRKGKKLLFSGEDCREVDNINGYLINMDNVIIDAKASSISNAPSCCYGSMQIGNNHLSITEAEIVKLPKEFQNRFVRKYIGGDELINNTSNWCLWLKDASPKDIRQTPLIAEKVGNMRQYRLSSSRAQTNKLADTPHLFGEIRQPDERMLVIPKVSSERREYIPMDFVEPNVIISGSALIVAGASVYDFGVLTSSVHMAWMRIIGGRLEMRYQYSASIVYNNFPWPEVTEKQREEITVLAQAVLDARIVWPNCSLADLYAQDTMPPVLRKAHKNLDRAVLKLYGLKPDTAELDIVRHLLGLYKKLVQKIEMKRN